jgi:hypothetical protein
VEAKQTFADPGEGSPKVMDPSASGCRKLIKKKGGRTSLMQCSGSGGRSSFLGFPDQLHKIPYVKDPDPTSF